MIYKICAFTGHRPQNLPWQFNENAAACQKLKQILNQQISQLAANGFTDFLSGMAQGADTWAAEQVLNLRKKNSCPKTPLHTALQNASRKMACFSAGTLSKNFGPGGFNLFHQPRLSPKLYAGAQPLYGGKGQPAVGSV